MLDDFDDDEDDNDPWNLDTKNKNPVKDEVKTLNKPAAQQSSQPSDV